MREVVIVGAARTAIGTFGGTLKDMTGTQLGVTAVKAALERSGLKDLGLIGDVLIGNCFMRTDEINVARCIGLESGIPHTTPASTIQRQCASGMQATVFGAQKIMLGEDDVVVTGGVETMSRCPYVQYDMRWGAKQFDRKMVDTLFEGLTDPLGGFLMGITAENLAEKYNITREEQDELAVLSQNRAEAAINNGWFKNEIVPVAIPQKKGDPKLFDTDEHPRLGATVDQLAKLRPAFKKDGTVTAGNASGINDGAAALVLCAADKAKELGLKPLARIVGHAVAAVEPELMGYGPVPAIKKLMAKTGKTMNDVDLWEINEAFAAQYIAVEKLLELSRDNTNIVGSGIALGHPVGATGARIIVTLLHQLQRLNKTFGVASLCVGGGMGKAIMIERL